MHRRDPHDRNPGGAWPPRGEQSPCVLQPTGLDIRFQQGELDQIVLCAAAANAFVVSGERRERLDREEQVRLQSDGRDGPA